MRTLLTFVATIVLVQTASIQSAAAQKFELVEPTGLVTGRADVEFGQLLYSHDDGRRIYFSRDQDYDSFDRRYLGYYNYELNRVLRFPRAGNGLMQTADLDDPVPRFQLTRRSVRPIGATGPLFENYRPGYSGYGSTAGNSPPIAAPYYGPYPSPYYPPQPQSILIDSRIVANPALPPARVMLRNDGRREVQVGVVDLQNRSRTRSVRIPPGAAAGVALTRDSGGKRIANYRVVTPYGELITKEVVTDIPPEPRYEIVVHEWTMQSIAIDRTGKSPSPIEDVNFQGKGLGRFLLPPGPELQSGTINVVSAARSQGNEGAVAPILASEDQDQQLDSASPLERAAIEAQLRAQGR